MIVRHKVCGPDQLAKRGALSKENAVVAARMAAPNAMKLDVGKIILIVLDKF